MAARQQGVALIQILLLVAITSVFALFLTQQARQQVTKAEWAQARSASEIAIHSAESRLHFELLTSERVIRQGATEINFHGQPFIINNGVEVAIQDQSGLLGLHFLHIGRFVRLLESQGIDAERASTIAAVIRDWQDDDFRPRPYGRDANNNNGMIRNGNIPDITEIEKMMSLTEQEKRIIYDNATIFFNGDLNPLTATEELLQSLTGNRQITNQLILMRNNGQLDERTFRQMTNLQATGDLKYTVSNTMAIRYTAVNDYFSLTRDTVVALSPYASGQNTAVNILMDRM
jgi:general secretion pathway protein K